MDVPYTSGLRYDPGLQRIAAKHVQLDTCLYFPVDDAVADYHANDSIIYPPNIEGEVVIGYIYLCITAGVHYARFSYGAAVSAMSRLFAESEAIHVRFLEVLENAGGIVGLINVEHYDFPMLHDPNRSITLLGWEDYLLGDDVFRTDIDRMMAHILTQLDDTSRVGGPP